LKFKQILDEFPIENKDNFNWSIVGAIVITIILVLIQQKLQFSKFALIPIVLFSVFILRRKRRLFSDWTSDKDRIGEIDFEEKSIIFDKHNNQIRYQDIAKIDFRYNYVKGRNFAQKDIIHNGLAELRITQKNDEVRRIKFIIETKEQFEFLKLRFKQWYQSGIEIKEEFTDQKINTICLEMIENKSYVEVQQLKNELKKDANR
jgi:hypothetical protein